MGHGGAAGGAGGGAGGCRGDREDGGGGAPRVGAGGRANTGGNLRLELLRGSTCRGFPRAGPALLLARGGGRAGRAPRAAPGGARWRSAAPARAGWAGGHAVHGQRRTIAGRAAGCVPAAAAHGARARPRWGAGADDLALPAGGPPRMGGQCPADRGARAALRGRGGRPAAPLGPAWQRRHLRESCPRAPVAMPCPCR
jgi:hypothetical protein